MTKTTIEWADEVWNPVTGCTKVSQGCKNCYAERIAERFWGERKFTDVQLHPERLEDPLHWKKPRRVFVNSMSDLFHPAVPAEFITRVYDVMEEARQHTFIVLTKRPERIIPVLYGPEGNYYLGGGDYLSNVWHLTSVEDQASADKRIPEILKLRSQSDGWPVIGLSCEPLLGHVNLDLTIREGNGAYGYQSLTGMHFPFTLEPQYGQKLDWVICGGESGPHARPMHPVWARSLRDQCRDAGVPFFFKQMGEWEHWEDLPAPVTDYRIPVHAWEDNSYSLRVGKKSAGRLLDGREWNEYPVGAG